MTRTELEIARSHRNIDIILENNIKRRNKIFISFYTQENKTLYSIRVNDLSKRINGLNLISTLFTLYFLHERLKTKDTIWPRKSKLKIQYYQFKHLFKNKLEKAIFEEMAREDDL